jgi:ATP adenylyltransferase/5',5'''-P-1,P-4-tetraphosphate phosphorylase II
MNKDFQKEADQLLANQLNDWDLVKVNYAGLQKVITREIDFEEGFKIKIQFNPQRMRSSAAKVDAKSIQERACFLCVANLPVDQGVVDFLMDYLILVNPFPIFAKHFTIPLIHHTDQRIESHFDEMLQMAQSLTDYVVFYNGPQCGASAPDHLHFQAGNKGFLPLEEELLTIDKSLLKATTGCSCYAIDNYLRKALVLEGDDELKISELFTSIYGFLKTCIPGNPEPMLNLLTYSTGKTWTVFIFPRKKHRPDQFFLDGDAQILLSPASVDFGGVLITPREEDFYKLNKEIICDIFNQVTIGDAEWELVKDYVRNLK